MKRAWLAVCSLVAGLALSGAWPATSARPSGRRGGEPSLAANGEFRLQNTNGSVRVTGWDQPRVRIEAVKHARSECASRAAGRDHGEGDRLSVRTRFPVPVVGGSQRSTTA